MLRRKCLDTFKACASSSSSNLFQNYKETAIYVGTALDEVLIGAKILYKVFYNHTLNVSKPSKASLFNRKNKLHYSKTKPIFHGNRVHIWQLRAWSVCQISRNTVRHHKQRVTRPLYSILLRGGHGGAGGGGVPNTAIPHEKMVSTEIPCRKWTKYRYRIYDRWRLLNVVSISRVFFIWACIHQKWTSALARKREKISN